MRMREERKSEFEQKLIDLRRVTRVVAGGRRFSFRACVVTGDRKGSVGVGIGKGADSALALEKAFREAKKHLVRVPLTSQKSVPFEVQAKYGAAAVKIRPGSIGHGLVAGGAVRTVLELAGVQSASAKILSHTKNRISNARAGLAALAKLERAYAESQSHDSNS